MHQPAVPSPRPLYQDTVEAAVELYFYRHRQLLNGAIGRFFIPLPAAPEAPHVVPVSNIKRAADGAALPLLPSSPRPGAHGAQGDPATSALDVSAS